MTSVPHEHSHGRRHGLNGLGALSLLLAAVIVLASTPAVLMAGPGSLSDPTSPISRVGSQLRRIAAAVPVRVISKAPKHDQHRPAGAITDAPHASLDARRLASRQPESLRGPALARLGHHCLDLPPPVADLSGMR